MLCFFSVILESHAVKSTILLLKCQIKPNYEEMCYYRVTLLLSSHLFSLVDQAFFKVFFEQTIMRATSCRPAAGSLQCAQLWRFSAGVAILDFLVAPKKFWGGQNKKGLYYLEEKSWENIYNLEYFSDLSYSRKKLQHKNAIKMAWWVIFNFSF